MVVLTAQPTANVTVTVQPVPTPTQSGHAPVATNVQVTGPGVPLTFTSANWNVPQYVTVGAVRGDGVDGGDLQAFANVLQRVHLIQGPLEVYGGLDPNPSASREIPAPIMLPGETPGAPVRPTATSIDAIEADQVDTLNVFNGDDVADSTAILTDDRLTGLGLADDGFVAGEFVLGGIFYTGLEDLNIELGSGADHLTILSTHTGTTRISTGAGADTVLVRTNAGTTTLYLGEGNDTVLVGTTAGTADKGTIDEIDALLGIDGGAGTDRVALDDRIDTTSDLGWLTQTALTGLDMTVRNAGAADKTYTLALPLSTTAYTLYLNGVAAGTFARDAAPETVADALQAFLFANPNSCGTEGETRCSSSVTVRRLGSELLIGFRGELKGADAPVLTAIGANGHAIEALRLDGVSYHGVETLDIDLGSGHDVLNVQGTTATTTVRFHKGDDRVYVSSLADTPLDGRPDHLSGHLDDVDGALHLHLGEGRHTLMISDELATAGDTDVRITDDIATNEILVDGLATGAITYGATDGTFLDGITIWTGSGADTIDIDGTFFRAAGRTITSLNTGLGNDVLTVDLDEGEDGFFVLNAQGAFDDRLQLVTDILLGDRPIADDAVAVAVNGVTLATHRYVVDFAANAIGLFDTLPAGAVVTVTITRADGSVVTETLSGAALAHLSDDDTVNGHDSTLPLVLFGGLGADKLHGGTGGDVIFGDRGTLFFVDGTTRLVELGNGGRDDRISDGGVWPIGYAVTRDTRVGGDDEITAGTRAGRRDIVLGGFGGDTITTNRGETATGDADGDAIVLGDNGVVDLAADGNVADIDQIVSLDTTIGGRDVVTTGRGNDVVIGGAGADDLHVSHGDNVVFGDNGELLAAIANAPNFGALPVTIGILRRLDPSTGGDDLVTSGSGRDAIIGGAGADTIDAGDGINLVLGDNGLIDWVAAERGGTAPGDDLDPSDIDRIETTELDNGGADEITTGRHTDVVLGGFGADTIDSGDGADIVLGDNGALRAALSGPAQIAGLPLTLRLIEILAPELGGDDEITTRAGADIVLGGLGADTVSTGDGEDLVLGDNGAIDFLGAIDRIRTTDRHLGGGDRIETGADDDIAIGGTGNDLIDGGSDQDLVFGDSAILQRQPNANDPRFVTLASQLMYTTLALANVNVTARQYRDTTADVPSWAFYDITELWHTDTETIGFGNDTIAGGAGHDVIFGQLGDDRIQGDGDIDDSVSAVRDLLTNALALDPSTDGAGDGDDYIEGGGGADLHLRQPGPGRPHRRQLELLHADHARPASRWRRRHLRRLGHRDRAATTSAAPAIDRFARDADVILGDNGNVFRLVGVGNVATRRLPGLHVRHRVRRHRAHPRPRRQLLDYTLGGRDFNPAGYALTRPRRRRRDPRRGRQRHRLRDAGRRRGLRRRPGRRADRRLRQRLDLRRHRRRRHPRRRRPHLDHAQRHRRAALRPRTPRSRPDIATPGSSQTAVINVTGKLNRTVDLQPFNVDGLGFLNTLFPATQSDDILFGGWGDDALHGGSGDDAMSGAEAGVGVEAAAPGRRPARDSATSRTLQPRRHRCAERLAVRAGEFALYDEIEPLLEGPRRRQRVHPQLRPHGRSAADARYGGNATATATTSSSATSATTGWSAAPGATRSAAAGATTCTTPTTSSTPWPAPLADGVNARATRTAPSAAPASTSSSGTPAATA